MLSVIINFHAYLDIKSTKAESDQTARVLARDEISVERERCIFASAVTHDIIFPQLPLFVDGEIGCYVFRSRDRIKWMFLPLPIYVIEAVKARADNRIEHDKIGLVLLC